MRNVIRFLNDMREQHLIVDYALGGATALVYYLEPVHTQDIDIFVNLPKMSSSDLVDISPLYDYLIGRGAKPEGQYLIIDDTPVQLLVPYNGLVERAVSEASNVDFLGETVRIPQIEYLMAIMVQTGRPKDRARLAEIFATPSLFDAPRFEAIIIDFKLEKELERVRSWI